MNQTNDDKTRQLSQKQQAAVAGILAGANDSQIAEAAGVTRQTVCDWRNKNLLFQSELNSQRLSLWSGYHDRLRRLTGRALDIINAELEDGSLPAAIAVLRAAGFRPGAIGPSDEQRLKDEAFGRSMRLAGQRHQPGEVDERLLRWLDGPAYQRPETQEGMTCQDDSM